MIIRRLTVALAVALFLMPGAARAEAPLGMEDAVRLALANNERALKAPLRVEAAEGQLDKARTAFLPTLTAQGQGTLHTLDKNNRVVSGQGTLQLQQPLVNLSSFPLYSSAKHSLESERWGAAQDKRLLAFDTARAFLVVLSSEHLRDSAKDKLDRARATQADAEARAKAQLAGSNDVTLAMVDTAGAARDLATAEGNVTRAYVALSYLVGRTLNGPLAAPDRTMRAATGGAFNADDAVKLAESRRPDVRSSEEKTLSLRESAKEPLYRLAPTLSVNGQVKVVPDPLPPDKLIDESAQLTLTWNIYDAGVRYADRRTRVAQAESQALDERALKRSIASDVGQALATLKASRDAFRFASDAATASRRHTDEVLLLYKQGLAKGLDLVDANGRRYDAEVSVETAQLAMEQAYLDLRLAMGLDPIEDPASAGPPPAAPAAPAAGKVTP
jgi:outer membrane protein TolC